MTDPDSSIPVSFEQLVGSAPDAVVVHDMENNVVFLNSAAEELYGWKLKEVKGRTISRIFYLDTDERKEAVNVLLDSGRWEGELRQIDRSGDEHLILCRQQLVRGDDGAPAYVLSYNTDVTELRKQQDAEERAHHIKS